MRVKPEWVDSLFFIASDRARSTPANLTRVRDGGHAAHAVLRATKTGFAVLCERQTGSADHAIGGR